MWRTGTWADGLWRSGTWPGEAAVRRLQARRASALVRRVELASRLW